MCSGYVSGARKVPKSVRVFIQELVSLKKALSDLQDKVILEPDIAEAFNGHCSSIMENLQSQSTIASGQPAIVDLMDHCKIELNALLKTLKANSSGPRGRSIINQLVWPLREKAMQKAVDALHRDGNIFDMSISIDNLSLNTRTHMELKAVRKDQSEWLQSETTRKILNWLSPSNIAKSSTILPRSGMKALVDGSWCLKSSPLGSADPQIAFFGVRGDQVLEKQSSRGHCPSLPCFPTRTHPNRSLVVDLLQAELDDNGIGLAYIYCDYNEQDQQTPSQLIGALNKQLARQSVPLPAQVRTLYTDSKELKVPLDVNQQIELFHQLVALFPTNFIVIDALDEADGLVKEHRRIFLDAIRRFMSSPIRLLVTSRPHARDIDTLFQSRPKLRIVADENDVGS